MCQQTVSLGDVLAVALHTSILRGMVSLKGARLIRGLASLKRFGKIYAGEYKSDGPVIAYPPTCVGHFEMAPDLVLLFILSGEMWVCRENSILLG